MIRTSCCWVNFFLLSILIGLMTAVSGDAGWCLCQQRGLNTIGWTGCWWWLCCQPHAPDHEWRHPTKQQDASRRRRTDFGRDRCDNWWCIRPGSLADLGNCDSLCCALLFSQHCNLHLLWAGGYNPIVSVLPKTHLDEKWGREEKQELESPNHCSPELLPVYNSIVHFYCAIYL